MYKNHFQQFRKHIIGDDLVYLTPYGKQKMLYADWIASGRLYAPIEEKITCEIGPFVGNTHTETSESGTRMTIAYHLAQNRIKDHVNAGPDDVLITSGFGMTTVVNKLQRMMGLKICGRLSFNSCIQSEQAPVVFITHMEHHSNHTSWYETNAEVVILAPGKDLLVDPDDLIIQLEKYKNRKVKIGAFTACSNVTGITTPYHQLARIMHEHGGVAIIDFAASAPYADINMHPADPMERLDAIMFSPHKFLGGPGSSGVLVFNKDLYKSVVPDTPGGGTVDWTNPWGGYKYIDDIEVREDGGTPGFLQAMKTALCIDLKNKMDTTAIHQRESELVKTTFEELRKINGLHILADVVEDRLGVFSFYFTKIHYNLVVRLLSDRFGIQVRGGCACAGTYGHYLLDVSYEKSKHITELINLGDLSQKPGWIRLSLHPTMTDDEIYFIADALKQIRMNYEKWQQDYEYIPRRNEFVNKLFPAPGNHLVDNWLNL